MSEQEYKELRDKELQKVSGGVDAASPHCPKCHSTDLELVGKVDIGTLPTFRCKACGYEWMLAL